MIKAEVQLLTIMLIVLGMAVVFQPNNAENNAMDTTAPSQMLVLNSK